LNLEWLFISPAIADRPAFICSLKLFSHMSRSPEMFQRASRAVARENACFCNIRSRLHAEISIPPLCKMTCSLLSAHSPLLWIDTDSHNSRINAEESLICYPQHVVKKTKLFAFSPGKSVIENKKKTALNAILEMT